MLYRLKIVTSALFLLCITKSASAQLSIIEFPKSLQLYPRKKNNFAHVHINVIANDTLAIIKTSKTQWSNILVQDTIFGNSQGINIKDSIYADTILYQYKLFSKNDLNSLLYQADSIVAGDIIVASGQSNMEAKPQPLNAMNGISNIWIRTFGSASNINEICENDTNFYLAQSEVSKHRAYVGSLLYYTGVDIFNITNVPILLINGAVGGSAIESHLPNTDNYNRFLYRIKKSGASQNIKSFIWYQGENNTDTTYVTYFSCYKYYLKSLQKEIGNFDLVIMQIRHGCKGEPYYIYNKYLRNIQRNIPNHIPNAISLPTIGNYDFDGCHFYTSGYKSLSAYIAKAILYQSYHLLNEDVLPPQLIKLYYKDSSHIILKFNKPIQMDTIAIVQGKEKHAKHSFSLNNMNDTVFSHVNIDNDSIILTLYKNKIIADTLWYTPERNYPYCNDLIYGGPYIMDYNQLPALTFAEPIDKDLLKKNFQIKGIDIYPNPIDNNFSLITNDISEYKITDIFGATIKTISVIKIMNIDMQPFANGIYFLVDLDTGKTYKIKKN